MKTNYPKFKCKTCGSRLVAVVTMTKLFAVQDDGTIPPDASETPTYTVQGVQCMIDHSHWIGYYYQDDEIREWTEDEIRKEALKRG